MFQYKIAKFTPQRLLSREVLQAAQNIAYHEQLVRYHSYSDGILTGCQLYEENMHIGVHNGMVKFAGRIYTLPTKQSLPYQPTDAWTVLKIKFNPQTASQDFHHYTGTIALESNTALQANEIELGRFKLKKGSRLRTDYTDFRDMETEYDTVCLLHIQIAAPQEATVSPQITTQFAREAYPYLRDIQDTTFCAAGLATGQALSREYIQHYISHRLQRHYQNLDNIQIYHNLTRILDNIKSGKPLYGPQEPTDNTILIED